MSKRRKSTKICRRDEEQWRFGLGLGWLPLLLIILLFYGQIKGHAEATSKRLRNDASQTYLITATSCTYITY
jgi:hypothetical protein